MTLRAVPSRRATRRPGRVRAESEPSGSTATRAAPVRCADRNSSRTFVQNLHGRMEDLFCLALMQSGWNCQRRRHQSRTETSGIISSSAPPPKKKNGDRFAKGSVVTEFRTVSCLCMTRPIAIASEGPWWGSTGGEVLPCDIFFSQCCGEGYLAQGEWGLLRVNRSLDHCLHYFALQPKGPILTQNAQPLFCITIEAMGTEGSPPPPHTHFFLGGGHFDPRRERMFRYCSCSIPALRPPVSEGPFILTPAGGTAGTRSDLSAFDRTELLFKMWLYWSYQAQGSW